MTTIDGKSSYFIADKALFGSYPTAPEVRELESRGVNWFVNLTSDNETIISPYTTRVNYIQYAISDNSIPADLRDFSDFIIRLFRILINGDTSKMYIHCKGGHGRSGIVVSCLACLCFDMDTTRSLEYTNNCHYTRGVMRHKWRVIGSPQTREQKDFVSIVTRPVIFSVSDFDIPVRVFNTPYDNLKQAVSSNELTIYNAAAMVNSIYTENPLIKQWVDDTYLGLIYNDTPGSTSAIMADYLNDLKLYHVIKT